MISKLYYLLTAYIPRPLPRTEKEYKAFKKVMVEYYGVPNKHPSWIMIAGQITSTPSERLRRPWGNIANCAKRLLINKLAQDNKLRAVNDFNKVLEKQFQAEAAKAKQKEDEANDSSQAKECSKEQQEDKEFNNKEEGKERESKIPANAPTEESIQKNTH